MDKIIMKKMGFYGYHGVLPEEKAIGQKFFVDAALYLSLEKAGQTDDLAESVSYKDVYDLIKGIVTGEKFNLLEGLAERICQEIIAAYPAVEQVKVKIKKPEAPVEGIFDYFGVEIKRERKR